MRNNKLLLFAFMGFISGVVGSLFSEIIYKYKIFNLTLSAIFECTICACIITIGIFWAEEIYNRKQNIRIIILQRAIIIGSLVGILASCFALVILDTHPGSEYFHIVSWSLIGMFIGWKFSYFVPNFDKKLGIISGTIGGMLGVIVFIIINHFFSQSVGRIVGVGFIGMNIALAMGVSEILFRKAT